MSSPRGTLAVNFAWLIRLRWAAVVAQAASIVGVDRLARVPLPMSPMLALVAASAATNLGAWLYLRSGRPVAAGHIGGAMVIDVLTLTGLLYLSGGPMNPFSSLYLVEITLAALVLSARWTWLLVALSMAASAFLFLDHRPLVLPAKTHDEHMAWHLYGMWVAFGVTAAFIVYFVMRLLRALSTLGARAERQDRLAALATLAGGAAHELSTPLATIATVAKELERRLGREGEVAEDLRLLRSEVDRCRRILDGMSAHAGESAGEALREVTLAEVAAEATAELPATPPVRVEVAGETRRFLLPPRALSQAVRVLVQNAQEASRGDTAEVMLRARAAGATVTFEVEDRGEGMPAEVLARAGEPFFTTKPPGRGMGLGLFLSRAVAERLGGGLELSSRPGAGTTAKLRVRV